MSSVVNTPGTISSSNDSDYIWINRANVTASDDVYSSCGCECVNIDTGPWIPTATLKCTNFGFSIPSDQQIDGIEVRIEWHASLASSVEDEKVRLIIGGNESGNNNANYINQGTTDSTIVYGSPTDKWGLSLTYSDINSSNFGVAFQAGTMNAISTGTFVAYVDYITITVYYSTPSGKTYSTCRTLTGVGI